MTSLYKTIWTNHNLHQYSLRVRVILPSSALVPYWTDSQIFLSECGSTLADRRTRSIQKRDKIVFGSWFVPSQIIHESNAFSVPKNRDHGLAGDEFVLTCLGPGFPAGIYLLCPLDSGLFGRIHVSSIVMERRSKSSGFLLEFYIIMIRIPISIVIVTVILISGEIYDHDCDRNRDHYFWRNPWSQLWSQSWSSFPAESMIAIVIAIVIIISGGIYDRDCDRDREHYFRWNLRLRLQSFWWT